MNLSRHRLALLSWIAFFAILFGSLAPAISHALNANKTQSTSWAEICSADGMRFVQVANQSPETSAPSEHGLHMEDCPFCLHHAGALGLPPSSKDAITLADGLSVQPALFYQSPHPLFIWSTAQSRAPPLFS